MDEANRDLRGLLQRACHVIADGRGLADGVGGDDLPGRGLFQVVERRGFAGMRDGEETDVVIGRSRKPAPGVGREPGGEFHVGLAAAEIDVAQLDVGERGRAARAADRQHIGAAGGHGRQRGAPAPAFVRTHLDRLVRQRHRDRLRCSGGAPDGDRTVALEHGMMAEDRGRRQAPRRRDPAPQPPPRP